jgi:hypothetical protein
VVGWQRLETRTIAKRSPCCDRIEQVCPEGRIAYLHQGILSPAGIGADTAPSWQAGELTIAAWADRAIATDGIGLRVEPARFKLRPTPFTARLLIGLRLPPHLIKALQARVIWIKLLPHQIHDPYELVKERAQFSIRFLRHMLHGWLLSRCRYGGERRRNSDVQA